MVEVKKSEREENKMEKGGLEEIEIDIKMRVTRAKYVEESNYFEDYPYFFFT